MPFIAQIMKEWAEADNQSKNLAKSERQALNEVKITFLELLRSKKAKKSHSSRDKMDSCFICSYINPLVLSEPALPVRAADAGGAGCRGKAETGGNSSGKSWGHSQQQSTPGSGELPDCGAIGSPPGTSVLQRRQGKNTERKLILSAWYSEFFPSLTLSFDSQPERVLQALKRYMAAEQKDRRHTLRHYQHIEAVDPQKAEQMKFQVSALWMWGCFLLTEKLPEHCVPRSYSRWIIPVAKLVSKSNLKHMRRPIFLLSLCVLQVYTHLHVIEERMNQSLALLYKDPTLAEELHDDIRKTLFTNCSCLKSLMFCYSSY